MTALRTAATTQLVAIYWAKQESSILAIIGNGSQSTFQTIAICEKFSIKRIQYYDIDMAAMQIYSAHIHALYPSIEVIWMNSSHEAAQWADIIITVTEAFWKQEIISRRDISAWAFIAGIGGDCPGKTELDEKIVTWADIIVEFEKQTRVEWEIQWYPNKEIHSSIYELVQWKKIARKSSESIVLFDSVGFALEDYSALHVIYEIAKDFSTPKTSLIPENMSNLKDLYGYTINKGNDFFPNEN